MVPDQTFQISIRFGPFRPTPVLESVSRPSPLNIESVGKTLNTKQRVLTLEAFPPSVFFIVLSKRRKLEPDFENGKTFWNMDPDLVGRSRWKVLKPHDPTTVPVWLQLRKGANALRTTSNTTQSTWTFCGLKVFPMLCTKCCDSSQGLHWPWLRFAQHGYGCRLA